jgi:hypothetical protein
MPSVVEVTPSLRLGRWPRFLSRYGSGTESWLRLRWSTRSSGASRRESWPELGSPTTWDRTQLSSTRFCRAYALALAKSPDQDGLMAFRELLDAAADELRLHQGYAARWDVELNPAADPATSAYTNFLLAVAAGAGWPHRGGDDALHAALRLPRPAARRSYHSRQSLSGVGEDLLEPAVRGTDTTP